jgi:DNA-binding CsgD family transcriptional regulator
MDLTQKLQKEVQEILYNLIDENEAAQIHNITVSKVNYYLNQYKIRFFFLGKDKYYYKPDVIAIKSLEQIGETEKSVEPIGVIENVMSSLNEKGIRTISIKDMWTEVSDILSKSAFEKAVRKTNNIFCNKGDLLIYTEYKKIKIRRFQVYNALIKSKNNKEAAQKLKISIDYLREIKKSYNL